MLWERMIPPLEQLSLPQLSVFSPNRAKRHFLDRRNIPRMNPETGVDGSNFLDWPETWVRGVDGFGIPDCPNSVKGFHLAIFPDIGTHSSGLLALNARPSNVSR